MRKPLGWLIALGYLVAALGVLFITALATALFVAVLVDPNAALGDPLWLTGIAVVWLVALAWLAFTWIDSEDDESALYAY
jgi:hypothetical protein